MKTALAIVLLALSGSVARADEPAPAPAAPAPLPNAQTAPQAKVEAPAPVPTAGAGAVPEVKAVPEAQAVPEAKVAPQAPLVLSPAPGNFCGQAQMLDWMLKTEVGQQLERERRAEMQKALEQRKVQQSTNVEVQKDATPPAPEAK